MDALLIDHEELKGRIGFLKFIAPRANEEGKRRAMRGTMVKCERQDK
jgi:hypothetical protein